MTMKLPRALTCALFLLSLPLTAAQTWKVDPNHSRIGFTISHLGISEITGDFRKYTVTVAASEEDFSDAVFELAIDASSIDTAVEKRDAHLKSPDFFDVSNHAKITFRSTSIKPAGDNRYTLAGDLTIHGETRPVTAELWYRGTRKTDKNTTAGFQLTATINRQDFGVGTKFSPPMIGNEVQIKADGEFILQK